MKLEDFLMRSSDDQHQMRLDLEQEVAELQDVLEGEQKLNQVLQCVFHGSIIYCSCLSSLLPLQVQELLAELAMTDEEIIYLEREIENLKLHLYEERIQKKERNLQINHHDHLWQRQQRNLLHILGREEEVIMFQKSSELLNTKVGSQIHMKEEHAPMESVSQTRSISCTKTYDEEAESSRRWNKQNQNLLDDETSTESPNKISEELMKTLISIFHKVNQTSAKVKCEPTISPKGHISCMSSRNFMSKSSFSCKIPSYSSKNITKVVDPYGIFSDIDGVTRDVGSYKKFIHFTRSSMDMSRISFCLPAIGRLRIFMHKLSTAELSSLTYKQKLAFWINIYNASVMHAFLQHGLPPSSDKLLTLLNKAALNVGGVVLNALAIEHFILRHSSQTQNYALIHKESIDEKEAPLLHAYGLGYPEPNISFALCRGSWSSPALRVYTAENVVNELEKAKIEYLDAAVGITSKKKIFVPKLLHRNMQDFADDVESLLEWIYSQLPRSGSLKRSIMECLSRDTKVSLSKLMEIQCYEEEFRYLLPPISKI